MGGVMATQHITAANPKVRVVVITLYDDEESFATHSKLGRESAVRGPQGASAGAYYPAEMPLAPQSTLTVPVSADDHVRGPVAAPVTVVEYGDYECPYCAAARPVLVALVDHSPGQVRLVFRNFPLADVHPFALTAALAAEAAAALGAFWPMHDLLFSKQDRLRDSDLAGYARLLGLPGDAVIGDAAQPF